MVLQRIANPPGGYTCGGSNPLLSALFTTEAPTILGLFCCRLNLSQKRLKRLCPAIS